MSEFNVIIKNSLAEGFSQQEVQENLARYLKISPEKFANLLAREATVVKKDVDSDTAEKYRKVLTKCGIQHEIQPSVAPAASQNSPLPEVPKPASDITGSALHQEQAPADLHPSADEPEKKKPGLLEPTPSDKNYSAIPFYRKPLTLILSFLFFTPALLIICLTGNIYFQKKGSVFQVPQGTRWVLIMLSAMYLIKGIAYALK